MGAIAYLKEQCGWSRGVREVLAKYGVEYEERQIHIAENFQEMVDKTGQENQPCVQLAENLILADVSGEELEQYLTENGHDYVSGDENLPLDSACTDEEHEYQNAVQNWKIKYETTKGGHNSGIEPHIPIKDTTFYGSR